MIAWTGWSTSASTRSATAQTASFLTCVADHQKPRIVWAARGRNAASLQAFFDQLSDAQKASIKAVSIDRHVGRL